MCENQKNRTAFCPVTAYVNTNINDNAITVLGLHYHAPRLVDVPMVHLRRAIGITGTKPGNMSTSVREIYNREIVE